MADRTVYGLNFSENGWRMVDQGSCVWVTVPGTNVTLQIREGQPAKILAAFAADFNAYVEPLRDGDSACWTATNSVASSNHLSGTAMDLNWNGADNKTFRFQIPEERAYPPPKNARVRELLDFYEDIVFCGGFWSIRDWMHFQMGGNTYGSQNVDRVNDFIRRKIRADGFSTFKRDGIPVPPPTVSKQDQYALAVMAEGRRRGITPRGIQIAFSVCFVESNWKMYANSKVPESLALPHDAVGQDHDSVGLFQQRCPMWGPANVLMDPAKSAGLFYDRLATMDYNNPNRLPGDFAADVQRPAAQYRGRYQERMGDAVALYNRLAGAPPPPVQGDDALSAEAERMIREIHRELTQRHPSRSPFRHLGEGVIDTWAGIDLNDDAHGHVTRVIEQARLGHPESIALLKEVAGADPTQYPDRRDDALLAQAVLASLSDEPRVVRDSGFNTDGLSRELVAAHKENASLRAEAEQLRAENARLQAAADTRTALEVFEPDPAIAAADTSWGAHASDVVNAQQQWTNLLMGMDAAERQGLNAALQALQLPIANGSKK